MNCWELILSTISLIVIGMCIYISKEMCVVILLPIMNVYIYIYKNEKSFGDTIANKGRNKVLVTNPI